jgi:subtilase family serine protease
MSSISRNASKWASVATVIVLVAASLTAQSAGRTNRISRDSSAQSLAALSGMAHPLIQRAADLGAVEPAMQLHSLILNIALTEDQQRQIAQIQADIDNPRSSRYHKYLTQEQYGALFGLTDADLHELTSWLTSQGFTVNSVSTSRNAIMFSGTAVHVAVAFHAQLHRYNLKGQLHFAPSTAIQIPARFAAVVSNIVGLDDFRPQPNRRVIARPNYTVSASDHYLSPADWATIYNVNALYAAGLDGTGVHVGIVGQTYAPQSDIDNFRAASGLSSSTLTYYCMSTAHCSDAAGTASGDLSEADLDIEWAGGIAKNATVDYIYVSAADTSMNVFSALQYAIQSYKASDGKVLPVVSMSYTSCEAQYPPALFPWIDALGKQANLQGQTILVASGDTGPAACDWGAGVSANGLSVNVPADSPNFTAVGGTGFSGDLSDPSPYWQVQAELLNSAIRYIPETTWKESDSNSIAASGGGESAIPEGATQPAFSQPTWQIGLTAGTTGRMVPDIAFAAGSAHDGYMSCSSDLNSADYGTSCGQGYYSSGGTQGRALYAVGGTSAAAPSFAGVLALLVQRFGPLGNINPRLYQLAADSTSASTVFHDVTTGDSKVPCITGTNGCIDGTLGYTATSGYDMVTGLGSIDAGALLAVLPDTAQHSSTTLSGSPHQLMLDGTATLTASVSCSGATGNVTFTLGNRTLGSSSLTSGAAILTIAASAANGFVAGSNSITGTYNGDLNCASSSGTTTVNVTIPSYTVTAGSNRLSTTPGNGGSLTLALTSNGYAGTVSFRTTVTSSDGSPANVTASASDVVLTADATGTSTLTITSTASASRRAPRMPWSSSGLLFCTALLGAPLARLRRRRLCLILSGALLLIGCLSMFGCKGFFVSNNRNYTVTITPTATGTVVSPAAFSVVVHVQDPNS